MGWEHWRHPRVWVVNGLMETDDELLAERVVGPKFELYFENLKKFWAKILGSPGPTRTTHWIRHWYHMMVNGDASAIHRCPN